jgi:hypothetical protein
MNKWIRTKDKVPDHGKDVEVIIIIEDIDVESLSGRIQQRLIAIGSFRHAYGWYVRNGYLKWRIHYEPSNASDIKKWEYVTHWREIDQETATILSKRGWDKEDFKD